MADPVVTIMLLLLAGGISFGFLVAAIYVGTTLALRSYFGEEDIGPEDVMTGTVRIEGDNQER